jgi:arylsulfatase A-like enzyme
MRNEQMIKKPNIVLIIMDSVRAANLSCYGYPRKTTPQIDNLATVSTLYEEAYSVGCWTLPVHTSLFTGLYPTSHGVLVSQDALPGNVQTLADQLRKAGYHTASFSSNPYISTVTGLTRGFDTVVDLWQEVKPRGIQRTKMSRLIKRLESFGAATRPAIWGLRKLQKLRAMLKGRKDEADKGARLTNQSVKEWLGQSEKFQQPFFIFINYMEVHEPYKAPGGHRMKYVPKKYSAFRASQISNYQEVAEQASTQRGKEDLEILQGLYDGELSYLDQLVGDLIQHLKTLGVLEDTALILTSDHGDSLGEHKHVGHRVELYDELLHVPLLVRYPPLFVPGGRISHPVSLIDLYPTLLELAGCQPANDAYENDFYSLVTPSLTRARPYLIAENTAPKSYQSVLSRAIQDEQYKLIWKSNQKHELYSLYDDPQELVNLFDQELEIGQKLIEELGIWVQAHTREDTEVTKVEYDETVIARLRDLGYVE